MSDVQSVQPTRLLESKPGVTSSMRLTLIVCLVLGGITILTGLAGWLFLMKTDAPLIIGAGTGLITLVAGAKAWQSQSEGA